MPATLKALTMDTLYFGDNLEVLRKHVADESVDLVYLDPPFNSKRDYNVIFKGDYSGTHRREEGAGSAALCLARR
jgi:16S rRNA G966 N2-methylase RsmD